MRALSLAASHRELLRYVVLNLTSFFVVLLIAKML